jgi:hypothetical protein
MTGFLKRMALALLIIVSSVPALAQQEDESGQILAAALGALDEFMGTFNSKAPEAWAASFNYPRIRFASGQLNVWNTPEEFAANSPFENLARTGWDHSHWISREVSLLSADKVHFNTIFQRFNSDNEVIGTYESLYIVTRVNGHWGTQARSSLAP